MNERPGAAEKVREAPIRALKSISFKGVAKRVFLKLPKASIPRATVAMILANVYGIRRDKGSF